MRRFLALCLALLAPAPALAADTLFFVATTGSDAAPGTSPSTPFATLARARDAARAVARPLAGDVIISIAPGAYAQPAAGGLALDARDGGGAGGGAGGAAVRWRGAGGGATVLHKGVAVGGWSLHDAARGVWSAPLPAGVTDTRQVYVNGERMNATDSGAGLPAGAAAGAAGYTTPAPLDWLAAPEQAAQDIELLYTGDGSSWTECRLRVAAVAPAGAGSAVTMQQPGWSLRGRFYGQGIATPRSVRNLYALLSPATPGAGYVNSATKTIYYVPRPQDDMASALVLVPGGDEVLVSVTGDRAAQPAIQRVTGLAFEGLTFSYAGWLYPSQGAGYVDMQSGFMVLPNSSADDATWTPVPANVQLHTVGAVAITGCTFEHHGATALAIDGGSQDVLVQNNTFRDVSGGGVYFGAVNDANITDVTRDDAHFVIDDNLFDGIPVEYRDCAPIVGGYVLNATITHNSILNNPNTGISVGWGWSRDEATNAGYNDIAFNYVYGSNWLLEDGGSLYVLGPQPSSHMRNNFISSQRKLFGALYTDEGSAYWSITANVVHNVPEWLHIWTSSIHDEVVTDNFSDQTHQQNAGTRITEANNTFLPPATPLDQWPAAAKAIMYAAGTLAMAGP